MDKISFFNYYFNNPLFAFLITVLLTSLFLLLYSASLKDKTIEYNRLLYLLKNSDNARGILWGVLIVAGIATFFGTVLVLSRYTGIDQITPFSTSLEHIAKGIYLIIPVIIFIFLIQPKSAEKRDVKKLYRKNIRGVEDLITSYINAIANYDKTYDAQTRIEISQIVAEFKAIESTLKSEKATKGTLKNYYDSLSVIDKLKAESKRVYERFITFQNKERKVYEYIHQLEYDLKFNDHIANKEKVKEQLDYLNNIIEIDVLKAYQLLVKQYETTAFFILLISKIRI
jgi:hypothetical protein